jgi:hypothetical protein
MKLDRATIALCFASSAVLLAASSARGDFVDVATPPLNSTNGNIGSAVDDFDGDGDLDIAVGAFSGAAPFVLLHRNDGGMAFGNVTASLGTTARTAPGVSWGDFDEDGDVDLAASGGDTGGGYLFRNNGNGTFNDVSAGGAFVTSGFNGRTIPSADVDVDGDLDIYIADASGGSRLLRNNGGTFQNVTPALLDVSTQCASWSDYDNDGDPDLYIGTNPGILARNDGNLTFVNVIAAAGLSSAVGKLSSSWGDFNNDGNMDLHMSSNADVSSLFRNNGNGTFSNVTAAPMNVEFSAAGTNWLDFDNDGDLDLFQGGYFGGGSRLFRNNPGAAFDNVLTGPVAAGNVDDAPAGDFDDDGDLDIFISAEGAADRLLRNDLSGGSHWLHVDLRGTISNVTGIGARVTLVAAGSTQTREVSGGNGWSAQDSPRVEFGLGAATTVTSLTVRWPSGQVQILSNVPVDRLITVTEPGFVPITALSGGFNPGVAFDLRLTTGGADVASAILAFRAAGSSDAFTLTTMTVDSGNDQIFAAVSGGAATENGVEYVVTYRLNSALSAGLGGTARFFPKSGVGAPAFLPANLGTRAQPAAAPANEHVLFGVPFVAGNATFSGVLEDDLGAYDNTKWRFGRFSPSAGTYLEAGNAGSLTPGRGFWIIERNPVVIDAAGVSTNTVGGTSIPVDPGWNQIGHPYLFNVPTSAVDRSDAPNVANRFVSRVSGAYQDVTTLEPWKGYWVFNSGSGTQTIVIPGQVGLPPAPRAATLAERLDWGIEVRARAGSSSDLGNFAAAASAEEAEALTLPEPPGLPGTVRVSFDGGGRSVSSLTTDVRASGRSSETFDVRVETGIDAAELTFDGFASLPSDRAAILVDDAHLAVVSLDAGTKISLDPEQSYLFRLVVGTSSELDRARAGLDLVPTEVVLAAPRPNPFAGETTIAFAIPEATAVDLAVFDVAGRLVRRLQEGPMGAGVHRILWNGTDEGGAKVSTGVYFAKLRTSSAEKVQKVVVLK